MKPADTRTEEEDNILAEYKAEQKRLDVARKQEEARRKAESDAIVSAYFKNLNSGKQDENSIEWFMKKAKDRVRKYNPICISNPDAVKNLPAMLKYAYEIEVESRGRKMIDDEFTNKVVSVVCRWMTSHDKPGLMLRGYIGVGKTTMMYAIATAFDILEKKKITIVDAMGIINAARDSQTQFKEFAECEMLGIDDLGTEPVDIKKYGNDCSPITELLTERYNHRRFTIITTNLTKEELLTTYGERLYDRFNEMFNSISYDAAQKSYRL